MLIQFLKKQWFSVLLLAAVLAGTVYAVNRLRPRGSMSVVEAQAMDMTAMKAPIGVYPVGTDYALQRVVGGSERFPATIMALNDEDVVARVAGLVSEIYVYPGDRVSKGRLLARISADETLRASQAGALSAQAAGLEAQSADAMVRQELAAVARAKSGLKSAAARIATARAELKAAQSSEAASRGKVAMAEASISERNAEMVYAQANFKREQELFEGGAISRTQLEEAKRDLEMARSRVSEARAQLAEATSMVAKEGDMVEAAQSMVQEAVAERAMADSMLAEAEAGVARARRMASAARAGAGAAAAEAAAMGAMASYLELRASADGVVSERTVSPGTPVMMGQTVLKVKTDGRLRVQANLPQSLAGDVRIGTSVRITSNGQIKEASVTSVFPVVQGATRTFTVESLIDNEGRAWEVGAYADLEVFVREPVRALSVRNEAVKRASDGSHYVWKVETGKASDDADAEYTCTMHPQVSQKGPGICPLCKMDLVPKDARGNSKAVRAPVTIGARDSHYTEVLSGLRAGDQVTYAGDDELFPSAAVKPVKWDKDGPVEIPGGSGQSGPSSHEGHGGEATQQKQGGGSGTKKPEGKTSVKLKDPYTCPMHPEVVQEGPGTCPICKMDLVPMKDGGE